MTEKTFRRLISKIGREELRWAVEDSAICNANDTMVERGYKVDTAHSLSTAPWGKRNGEFWAMAVATAKMILDCPKDYYPELFQD